MVMKAIIYYLLLGGSTLLLAQPLPAFSVSKLEIDPRGIPTIEVPILESNYYVLIRKDLKTGMETAVQVILPENGTSKLTMSDPSAIGQTNGFYRVKQIDIATPKDSDGDGIDDLFELNHPLLLNPTDPSDAAEDADLDGASNLAEYLAPSNPADLITTNITFITADNVTLSGTYQRPAARPDTKFPVVILIHQGGSNQTEWNPYRSAFTTAGYATFSYDIRGHGQSGGSFSNSDYNNPDTIPKDVVAALAYVHAQPSTEITRVGIVGASVGGNLACVASQKQWVKTAVNLSGKTSAVQNLAEAPTLNLDSMFHISSSGDQNGNRANWANELYSFTTAPRQVEIVSGSSAHGVSILTDDPSLLDRIIEWMNTTL